MGRYIRKNPDGDEGIRPMGRIEKKVLEAWRRGERTAEEISEMTGIPLKTVYKYIPRGVRG